MRRRRDLRRQGGLEEDRYSVIRTIALDVNPLRPLTATAPPTYARQTAEEPYYVTRMFSGHSQSSYNAVFLQKPATTTMASLEPRNVSDVHSGLLVRTPSSVLSANDVRGVPVRRSLRARLAQHAEVARAHGEAGRIEILE